MASNTGGDTLVPLALLPEVYAAAQEEHRAAGELVGEAIERYLQHKRWQKIFAYGEQRARDLGLSEDDVPRLIKEYRQQGC